MKKLFYFLACVILACAACSKEDESGKKGPVIVNDGDILVGSKEVLDPDTQKAKLEQVGNKFMQVFPAKEYEDMMELSEIIYSHCDKYFSASEYDWSELEVAGEGLAEELYNEKQKSEYKWEYTYTLFLSNCTGVVTLGKNRAEFEEAAETKLIIEDVEGEDWEAVLVSKDLKTVFLGEWFDTYYDYVYDEYSYEYKEVEGEEAYHVTVEIPKSLTFNVTREGQFVATVTLKFDYSISEGGVNREKDRINVEAEIKIDDLVMTLEQASVNAETGDIKYSQSLKKGELFIVSQKLSSNMTLEYEEEDGSVVEAGIKEATANVDFNLLGELQLKGSCTDLRQLVEILDESFDSERQCERAAENATELIDINVYYDCQSTVQARIEFEPVSEYDEYLGYESLWIEPVIVFEDGSRYLFEKYFKERDFRDLIENFEDFVLDYEEMAEDIY